MKKLLLGSVALAAMLAGPAMAADMPVKAKAPPPLLYDWSGLYVGASLGGMWYDIDRTFPNSAIASNFTTSDSDAIYGFHAGFQQQWGAWVLGLEASLSGCFQECRGTSGVLPVPPFAVNTAGEHKITNLFTVGPRLGYAWDRFMIYATGGAAAANLKGQYCNTAAINQQPACGPGVSGQNGQSVNWGWFVGGGFEYMVHKGPLVDVILGVEYQHWDVDDKNAFCVAPGCGVANAADYSLGATGDLVRARLTIKTGWGIFGGPAPVVAKY